MKAALWGLALGLLAPLTTGVMLLSSTAADDVTLVGQVDLGFFAGFLPMIAALATVLVSLNHWPLRDVAAHHRELTLALLLVGFVEVVELRLLTQNVISDHLGDAWLFVNGSMVVQALLVYWLIRSAGRHLSGVHAYHAGWPIVGPISANGRGHDQEEHLALRSDAPRYTATWALAFRGLLWGVIIAAASGAAAGTILVPVLGTLVGAYFGAIYGLVPAGLGALTVVVAVSWRRDTDPEAIHRAVNASVALVGIFVMVGLWPALHTATFTPAPWEDANLVRTWLTVLPVVVLLLRHAAPRLANTYVRFCAVEGSPPASEQGVASGTG